MEDGGAAVDWQRMLRLLGLGVRGRLVVVGVERVREAAKRGTLRIAVIAPDASKNSLQKVLPMLDAKKIRYIEGPNAAELGAAVGRDTTAVVGVVDRELANGIRGIVKAGSEKAR